jgi:hypothetical protein
MMRSGRPDPEIASGGRSPWADDSRRGVASQSDNQLPQKDGFHEQWRKPQERP